MFKTFVLDTVEDLANRGLTVSLSYETARQGENQTAQAFALELTTMEEQMSPYTEEQRTRHLLAKLKPALRVQIVTYHSIPTRREDLVVLATRLKSAGKRDLLSHPSQRKADASDSKSRRHDRKRQRASPPPSGSHKQGGEGSSKSTSRPAKSGLENVTCYGCNKKGYYKNACPNNPDMRVRQVAASAEQSKR